MTRTNNERLRELIDKHGLTRADIAALVHASVPAVNKWLASPADRGNYRGMPDVAMELLEIKLGERQREIWEKTGRITPRIHGRKTKKGELL